jgi:hypothetical protein
MRRDKDIAQGDVELPVMERAAEGRTRCDWRGRDVMVAVALFVATAGVVLWQCGRVGVMWDISYMLDSSWRMALGQMPYRDFPFVHPPLTFLMQAAVMRVTGRVFFHHELYAAVVAGLGTVVTWRIVLRSLWGRVEGAWGMAALLAMPLVVLGVYGIFPTPFYDCDCVFLVLVTVWMLGMMEVSAGWAFGAGMMAVAPVFCKQNIGVPFLLVVLLGAAGMWVVQRRRVFGMVLAGAAVAMAAALGVLHWTAGIGNYVYWTVTFAGQRRLPGMGDMLGVYREPGLVWMLPCVLVGSWLLGQRRWAEMWVRVVGVGMVVAPLTVPVVALFLSDDAEDRAGSLLALWPLLLVLAAGHAVWRMWRRDWGGVVELAMLAAIHGTLLSQQLWGSTYAIWPLWVLLLAEMLGSLLGTMLRGQRRVGMVIAGVVGVVLVVCGGLYARSEDRLSYARVEEGTVVRPRYPELKGMSVRGEYMPEFEQLLDFAAKEIPRDDALILFPGEDPFYFATGRVPRFPVLLFDRTTDPYSPEELVEEARAHDVRWVIVKTKLQLKEDPTPERAETLELLRRDYGVYRRLDGYEVWRRR